MLKNTITNATVDAKIRPLEMLHADFPDVQYLLLFFLNLGRSSRGGRQKLILQIITLMVNHPSGSQYYYYFAVFNAPCVGHENDESQY